ncbi:MAG: 4Fe-4S dicluster domain-containing protein [Dehalococcoidia bacterium]|nr:4Fe-4S dicluster domain-containing protein [Dehalococcoidia bacterium]
MEAIIAPVIDIDRERCTTPFACKKCLQICPTAVLAVHETRMVRLEETDKYLPGTYRLRIAYRDKCSGCNRCVDVCPEDAITVRMLEEVGA